MTATTKSTAQVLREAKALIEDPKHWVIHTFSETAKGDECDTMDPEASCFCALGALYRVAGYSVWSESSRCTSLQGYAELSRAAVIATNGTSQSIAGINDHEGHAAVMALYNKAIELADGEAA